MSGVSGKQFSPTGSGILVVEDEKMLAELLVDVLGNAGFRVQAVENGEEAIATFSARPDQFALVICDVGLPKFDGLQVFRAIKEIRPDVKVILASGTFDPLVRAQLIREGALEFLAKPYVPRAVVDAVLRALN